MRYEHERPLRQSSHYVRCGTVKLLCLLHPADGHVHALWFNFAEGWHHEDRSTLVPGVPPAMGDPFGYAFIETVSGL